MHVRSESTNFDLLWGDTDVLHFEIVREQCLCYMSGILWHMQDFIQITENLYTAHNFTTMLCERTASIHIADAKSNLINWEAAN